MPMPSHMSYKDQAHAGQTGLAVRPLLLVLLAAAAGSVDAVSYTSLGEVFPANMTGNTVLLGLAIGGLKWDVIWFTSAALLGFVIGVAIGAWVVGQKKPNVVWSPRITSALFLETLILIGVLGCWQMQSTPVANLSWQLALIIGMALAMGLQSVAIYDLAIAGVSMTYITGTLTNLVSRLVQRPRHHDELPTARSSGAGVSLVLWLVYLGGATAAALLIGVIEHLTLALPIAFIVIPVLIPVIYYPRDRPIRA